MNNKTLVSKLIKNINKKANQDVRIMEVCGTHTYSIYRYGIKNLIDDRINLISGPGCPVCVTPIDYIDRVVEIMKNQDVIIATFGDMARVKGSYGSLLDQRTKGGKIVIVYSPLDGIKIAQENRDKDIIFLAVGFETTMPTIAMTIKIADKKNINNLYFLTSLKFIRPILHKILENSENKLDGLICPGHIASVMGANYFSFISSEYNMPAVVCGFEALDIVGGIYNILNSQNKKFHNLYRRCVRGEGNLKAKELIKEVFTVEAGNWRGIGRIKDSQGVLNKKYEKFNGFQHFNVDVKPPRIKKECECSEVILGNITPYECSLFGEICNPNNPMGPCMVSSEGTCGIYFKYRGGQI